MSEEWRPILDFPGYEVSDAGRVRSNIRWRGSDCRILKLKKHSRGYLYLGLAGKKNRLVHRLVLEAFTGPCPVGKQCAHLSGVRTDNRLVNLGWVTQQENESHKVSHGTTTRGANNGQAKLTAAHAEEIYLSNGRVVDLAEKYGVSPQTVSDIRLRRRWGHLTFGSFK